MRYFDERYASKARSIFLAYYLVKRNERRERRKKQLKDSRKSGGSSLPRTTRLKQDDIVALKILESGEQSERKRSLLTANRFAAITSLLIHFIALLFAMFYVLESKEDDDYVEVDFTYVKPTRKLRRRTLTRLTKLQITDHKHTQLPQRPAIRTAAVIPNATETFVLPADDSPFNLNVPENFAPELKSERQQDIGMEQEPARVPSHITLNPPQKPRILPHLDVLPESSMELKTDLFLTPTIDLSDVTEPPRFIKKIIPEYPELAEKAGKEGIVILEAEIGLDGKASNISVVQSIGYGCDEAAIAALRASRFKPAREGNTAVVVHIQIPYRFRFEEHY